jgi:hypothetical protein
MFKILQLLATLWPLINSVIGLIKKKDKNGGTKG